MAAVTICSDFGAQEIKSFTVSIVFPSICHEVMGPYAMILVYWMLSFKPTLSLSSFTFIKRLFSFSSLSAMSLYIKIWINECESFPPSLIQPLKQSDPWHFVTCKAQPCLWYSLFGTLYLDCKLIFWLSHMFLSLSSLSVSRDKRWLWPLPVQGRSRMR